MSRFAQNTKGSDVVLNYEEDKAYKLTPEMELYSAVCCASLQPKFYVPEVENELNRIRDLISKVSPEFVAKLAIYTREQMYLRSIPLVLIVELAKQHKGDDLIKRLTERVIQRADEIYELLSYYQLANNRTKIKKLNKLSQGIKKGIKNIFESDKFDEYQYAKYNRQTDVTFKDAIFLTHPKPKPLLKKIIDNTLEIPYTWETRLSEAGQKGEDKKTVWEEIISSKKMGYMATLRNLNYILSAEVSDAHINQIYEYLTNPNAVRNSKQLPFRFLSAYRMLKNNQQISFHTGQVLAALEQAVKISIENVAGIEGKIIIACDVSGSMQNPISPNSTVEYYDIGLILGMLAQYKCEKVIAGFFGADWKVVPLRKDQILANADELQRREGEVGYATNGWKVLDWAIQNNIIIDKIMMFTDCQMWDSTDNYQGQGAMNIKWQEYKKINPSAKLYLFDLAGYGKTSLDIKSKNVFLIAGWSDKIFDILTAIEKGKNSIENIKNINL